MNYYFKVLQSAAGTVVGVFNRCILQIVLNQIAALFLSTFCSEFLKLLITFTS